MRRSAGPVPRGSSRPYGERMCDTLVTVTADGMIFGKNSDRDPNESQHLERVPARTHEPGSTLSLIHI